MGFLSPELSTKHMRAFTTSLARHASGGITISRSLELIADGQAPRPVRRVAVRMTDCIRRGATFAQAAQWERRWLPDFFVGMVDVAERSGHLEEMLDQLARLYEDKCAVRGAYVSQMVYPFLLLLSIVLLIPMLQAFLGSVFVPGWAGPAHVLARFAMSVTPWALIALILFTLGRLLPLKRWLYHIAARVWLTRQFLRALGTVAFLRSMAVLTSSHIATGPALRLAGLSCGHPPLTKELERASNSLAEGHTLSRTLKAHVDLPADVLAYIDVAEKSGRLDETFRTLARDRYETALYYFRNGAFLVEGALVVLIAVVYFGAPGAAINAFLHILANPF